MRNHIIITLAWVEEIAIIFKKKFTNFFNKNILNLNKKDKRYLTQTLLSETCVNGLIASTPEGLFCFDIKDQVVGWKIAIHGVWEEKETTFLKNILKEGDLVIDVGANLGWYTVIMAKIVKENGHVISFEPEPRNYELLQQNICLNGVKNTVISYQLALSNVESKIDFELSDINFGDHRVRHNIDSSKLIEKYNESSRKTISVSTECLDNFFDKINILTETKYPVKLMKIDTQGSEVAILNGGRKLLPKVKYLIIECWPYGLQRAGSSLRNFNEIIVENYSYFSRVSEFNEKNFNFKPVSQLPEDMASITHFVDYIFTN